MNFKESINWLNGFQKFGIKLGLDRIKKLSKELGNPEKSYKTIHVGGTNGKGSVCKFLGSILTSSGYKVGVYTSPHLQCFSERIVIDGEEISEKEIVLLFEKIKPIVEKMKKKGNTPTYFEIVTAMCFEYFKEKNVDYAVIEVGLGGRFDATNIIEPIVSVITNVSLDHQNILGNSIKEIAKEKAGIIKNKVPVITGARDNALKVIEKKADEKNAPLTIIDSSNWKKLSDKSFLIKGSLNDYNVKTSMKGSFQGTNIALAISVVETLQINGIFITENSIFEGIKKTFNPGRMEIVSEKPHILLDGAHNIACMNVLKETLEKDFKYDRLILVVGILSDKNIEEMLKIIIPLANNIIVTKSKNNRASNTTFLKDKILKLGFKNKIVVKNNVSDAVDYAKSIANKNDLICITGSLFTVGEARDALVIV